MILFFASVLMLGLLIGYIRYRQLQTKLKYSIALLKSVQDHEQLLQSQLNRLQTKTRHTLEDAVTGLISWSLFEDRLKQNIKESERYQFTMGVLYIDVDNFRVINDALGHATGDALLKEIAVRLSSSVRQVDNVCRHSKDTFIILLTQLAKPETAAIVAQRILQALSQSFILNQEELYITACIGIAIYPNDAQDANDLIRAAEQALHAAKEKGDQLYQFYQEKTQVNSQRELAIYHHLMRESIYQEFKLNFQPIINVQTEAIFCMDALLYWQHPHLGLIDSQELYAYAEKHRKWNSIAEWGLRHACSQFLHWRKMGFNPECLGMVVSINQLNNSHFIYQISHILQEVGFDPKDLLLEIKENLVTLLPDTLEKAFNMLKYLGIKLAIEDFGSGTFFLRELKNFKVNYLKLDKQFTQDIENNEQALTLLKAITCLGETMNIGLIATGIETDQQKITLKALGYALMQGQLLSPPIAERDVLTKIVAT